MTGIPAPGDPGDRVRAICDLIDGDPIHEEDRRRIVAAILTDGLTHGGAVDPNRVRRTLTNSRGDLVVYPRLIGAVYQAMTRTGDLSFAGWITNADTRGGNAGKPARAYRLTTMGAAA